MSRIVTCATSRLSICKGIVQDIVVSRPAGSSRTMAGMVDGVNRQVNGAPGEIVWQFGLGGPFHREVILSEAVLPAERRISQRKDLAGANVRLRETEDFLRSCRITNARRAGGNPVQARGAGHRRGTSCRESPGWET